MDFEKNIMKSPPLAIAALHHIIRKTPVYKALRELAEIEKKTQKVKTKTPSSPKQ